MEEKLVTPRHGTNRTGRAFGKHIPKVTKDYPTRPRVSLHTLGCKLNFAETETIAKQFVDRGFVVAPFGEETDVLVLNTCSVTENAEKECRQLIRRALRRSPNAFVAVTGCYAQLRPEEVASLPGVDAVLGANEKFEPFSHLSSFVKGEGPRIFASEIAEAGEYHAAIAHGNSRTRAFLKVQDGCDYSCSFCTIPKARGESRSDSIGQVVQRARDLSLEGFHEIVLSGINLGDFGRKNGSSFLALVKALDSDPAVTARLRISSIEPNLLKDEIIDAVGTSSKLCPHFHVPLQSGSSEILRAMQRRYGPELYRNRIERIRAMTPHACIGVDVIVGFPGESDALFEDTFEYLHSLDISYFHVFTYSERPGTRAATMPGAVPVNVRRERNERLKMLSEKKRRAFYASQIGREVTVVLERNGTPQRSEGYSENYIRVAIEEPEGMGAAEIVRARLAHPRGELVVAELIEVLVGNPRSIVLPILA